MVGKPLHIVHWMKKENSGLARTTLELAKYEQRLGQKVEVREPRSNETWLGTHFTDEEIDIHAIHSQIHPRYYKSRKPKLVFLHGEPNYGITLPKGVEAVTELMNISDASICFNPGETEVWKSFHRTYLITKGVDLEVYQPMPIIEKKPGVPAILYMEHWRNFRNPLNTIIALERVYEQHPEIKLYLVGCNNSRRWAELISRNRWSTFIKEVVGFIVKSHEELNRYHMVISPVFPSYGRVGLEAIACGIPVVGYDTNPHATFQCRPFDIPDMVRAINECIKKRPSVEKLRAYAERHLSAEKMAREAIKIYRRYDACCRLA